MEINENWRNFVEIGGIPRKLCEIQLIWGNLEILRNFEEVRKNWSKLSEVGGTAGMVLNFVAVEDLWELWGDSEIFQGGSGNFGEDGDLRWSWKTLKKFGYFRERLRNLKLWETRKNIGTVRGSKGHFVVVWEASGELWEVVGWTSGTLRKNGGSSKNFGWRKIEIFREVWRTSSNWRNLGEIEGTSGSLEEMRGTKRKLNKFRGSWRKVTFEKVRGTWRIFGEVGDHLRSWGALRESSRKLIKWRNFEDGVQNRGNCVHFG